MLKITGYASEFSVRPGDKLDFHIHCKSQSKYQADIERLIHGDTNPEGPGFKEELVETTVNREYQGREQKTYNGSFALVPNIHSFSGKNITIASLFYATTPYKGEQGLITKFVEKNSSGIGLFINSLGELELQVAIEGKKYSITSGQKILPKVWYLVIASYNSNIGKLSILHKSCSTFSNGGNGPRALPPMAAKESIQELEVPKNLLQFRYYF